MEEQRQRQEDEQRRAIAESDVPADGTAATAATTASSAAGATTSAGTTAAVEPNTEEALLQRALAMSTETPVKRPRVRAVLFSFFYLCFPFFNFFLNESIFLKYFLFFLVYLGC